MQDQKICKNCFNENLRQVFTSIKPENNTPVNILENTTFPMSEEKKSEKIKTEREEMLEESHQLELKEGYEQDEEYEESED